MTHHDEYGGDLTALLEDDPIREEIAALNFKKLASRQERGALGGGGDDR